MHSFTSLHSSELEAVAAALGAAGHEDLANRLQAYRDLHTQEAALIMDELADVQTDLERQVLGGSHLEAERSERPQAGSSPSPTSPADSPRRARWLAEQASRAERPLSRRELFVRGKDP
jgi:hypothetical protein